jgi:flagellin-specific chaperone FliS
MLEMTEMVYQELVRAVKAAQEAMEDTVPTL